MEIAELKTKFENLKKRLSSLETKVTIGETKKETLVKRLHDEFGIKPTEVKQTLAKMKADIDTSKQTFETTVNDLEQKVSEVEKIINV